jgi:hypothetical protein
MNPESDECAGPAAFAQYIGGLFGLGASVKWGSAVIKASPATVRDVGQQIAERGYDVEIKDGGDPARIVVSPTAADLRAVAEAHADGPPEPGEGLEVVDPVDRTEGDGGDGGGDRDGGEESPESQTFEARAAEVELTMMRTDTPRYRVAIAAETLEADRVRVGGVRLVLSPGAGAAFECDNDDEKLRATQTVEEIDGTGERVIEIERTPK